MGLTRLCVMNAMENSEYRKSQDIFLLNTRISHYEVQDIYAGEAALIKAEVLDSNGHTYDVSISVDNLKGLIEVCACGCGYTHPDGYICKHAGAVLLKYISMSRLGNEAAPLRRSGKYRFEEDMTQAYIQRGGLAPAPDESFGNIELEPWLTYENGTLYVEFKIGTKKKYVLKNILSFAESLRRGEMVSYGAKLGFLHVKEAFASDSRPLLDFILERAAEYMHVSAMVTSGYPRYSFKGIRLLPLASHHAGRLLDMLMGRQVQLRVNGTPLRADFCPFLVTEEDPRLNARLKVDPLTGFMLQAETCPILQDSDRIWLIRSGRICKCSEAFSSDMVLFLTHMIQRKKSVPFELSESERRKLPPGNPYAGRAYSVCNPYTGFLTEEDALVIPAERMSAFCGNVLKTIMPHLELEHEHIDIEKLMPPPVAFSIYLDCPESGMVTCLARANYGETTVDVGSPVHRDNGYRDLAAENKVMRTLLGYFRIPDEADRADYAWITDGASLQEYQLVCTDDNLLFTFLEQGMPYLYRLGEVYVSENMKRIKVLPSPKTSLGVSINSHLLELDIQTDGLSEEELAGILASYRRRQRFYRLRSGEFLKLTDNSLTVLSELADGLNVSEKDIQNGRIRVPLFRAAYVDSVLKSHTDDLRSHRDRLFKSLIRQIKSVGDSDYDVPDNMEPILRDYQKTGYRWLKTMSELGFGGILADEMGLGKTLQIIALLCADRGQGPALVVCPSSLVYNWDGEIERFAPQLSRLIISGSAKERAALIAHCSEYDVCITSYDMLKRDIDVYDDIQFRYQVIDEAQYIKNQRTQAAKSVCRIHSRTRFALTGTPIENRLSELWSIFEYLMPGFLYPYEHFRRELEQPIVEGSDEIAASRLRRMIGPFIMRRLKSDVLKQLPEKLEHTVYAKMVPDQEMLYKASALQLKKELAGSGQSFSQIRMRVLAELTKLRQLCCDPALLYSNYRAGSGKLDTCIQLLLNAMSGGHKVLLFSQFTSMLDIIQKRLDGEGIGYYRLDGSTKNDERIRLVDSFNGNDTPVFLISLKAGGTGLNLTGADMVIHYDPWWNQAVQNQATDRAHRIGQTHTVTVYKLICRHTIEEKILALQMAKQDLAGSVISGEGISETAMSKEDLLALLEDVQ